MNVMRILEMSLQVEMFAEQIYADLAKLFPEARRLFERLSHEESRHADMVMVNMKQLDIGSLSPEFTDDMVPLIKDTLEITVLLKKKIEKKDITIEEALQLSLKMEEAGTEAYFQDVMRGAGTHGTLNFSTQFFADSEHHAALIKEFKNARALKDK